MELSGAPWNSLDTLELLEAFWRSPELPDVPWSSGELPKDTLSFRELVYEAFSMEILVLLSKTNILVEKA